MKKLLSFLFALSVVVMTSFRVAAQDAGWGIAIAPNAAKAERRAAQELQSELKALFGKELPIVEGEAPSPAIRLGGTAENAKRLNVDFSTFSTDEIILKSVNGDLILAGATPRATFYAVYEYLERYLGVRFWAPDETYYPPQKAFNLPAADYRYAPPIHFREVFNDLMPRNPSFAVKLRNNWHYTNVPEEWGGHESVMGWCHTLGRLVSAKKYFGTHPEYFALVSGKRTANTQPCLTNKEFRKVLIEEALEWLKKTPTAKAISISQNDNQSYCTCDECNAFVQKNGNQTDLLLDVVNDVADAVKQQYPGVCVSTLAYQYTRALPKTIRPHDNVIIHLCSIECDFSKPLTVGRNEAFGKEVQEWSKMAKQLFIWNYVTNYNAFQLPHPNWKNLAGDIRFFVQNKALGIFEQGAAGPGYAGDLTTLRIYLLSKLLWNPTLDQNAIMDEYIDGYYGKCAPFIKRYIELCVEQIEKHPPKNGLRCFRDDATWMDDDALVEAVSLMNDATAAAKGDSRLELKIQRATSSIKFVLLDRSNLFYKYMPGVSPSEMVDRLVKLFKDAGCYRHREGKGKPELLKDKYMLTYAPPQEGVRPPFVKETDTWYAFSFHDHGGIHGGGNWTFKVDDPNATNGKAVKMPTNHYQWAIQINRYPNDADYDVYYSIRCTPMENPKYVLTMGLYDQKDKNDNARRVNASQIQGDTYKYVKFMELKAGSTGFFFAAPIKQDSGPELFFDRIIFVKK